MASRRRGEGQTALITGASSGIGAELARCFAGGGYNLVLVARSGDVLEAAGKNLAQEFGINAVPVAHDLGQPGAGAALVQTLAERGLTVDVLVNNAGYGMAGAFAESEGSAQLGMIDLNVRALVELTHIYWPRLLRNKRGGVLNVASTAAFQPGPFMAIYCATKAFVLSFSEALWEEARGTGVHVSCLCPGVTESGFHKRAGTDRLRLFQTGVMPAAKVARHGYNAFQANKRVEVAGTANALMAGTAPFMPRGIVLRVARQLLSPAELGGR